MPLILESPTVLRLEGYDNHLDALRKLLSYKDLKVAFELSKFLHNQWYAKQYGVLAYNQKIADLTALRDQVILFKDDRGYWTYSGMANLISETFDDKIISKVVYPASKAIPWAKVPEHQNRYYQTGSQEKLEEVNHGSVEIGTGLGKSAIIRNLIKSKGLQSVVMAPSLNIANMLYADLSKHFGKAKVGQYFDGKKQLGKHITVAVAASLTRIEENAPAWEHFSKAQVYLVDEGHLVAAQTLAKVCFGLMANAPYRFFFTGTHMRNDGLGLLLDAITGPIVYTMTVREGVDQGFLAKPKFRMVKMRSDISFDSPDVNEMTRAHAYYNPQVLKAAADLANKAVSVMGRPTLILVDEIEQFTKLAPYLRYEARFAHGGVSTANKHKLPEQYHKSDPTELVAQFNAGEFPILVGTSCVATGTDFLGVACIIYLRQGTSEIELKQAIGRGTRKAPGKEDCLFIDFAIDNISSLARHAKERKSIMIDTYPSYSEVTM